MRGQCSGNPWLHIQSPSPGKGHCPCRHLLALTLQQVGDDQCRALVTAGQPPLCQVLLDLEGEEIPVEGDRSMPWGELGAGLSHEGHACSHVSTHGIHIHRLTGGACSPCRRLQLGTTMTSTSLPLKCSLVDFRINILFCFGGHLSLLGLMFCGSTVLVLFLVSVCNAFSKIVRAKNVILKNKTKVVLSEHRLRQELD